MYSQLPWDGTGNPNVASRMTALKIPLEPSTLQSTQAEYAKVWNEFLIQN